MLNICSTVTVFQSSGQDPEAFSANSVHYRTPIGEEMDTPDDQHAAVVCKPAGRHMTVYLENVAEVNCSNDP